MRQCLLVVAILFAASFHVRAQESGQVHRWRASIDSLEAVRARLRSGLNEVQDRLEVVNQMIEQLQSKIYLAKARVGSGVAVKTIIGAPLLGAPSPNVTSTVTIPAGTSLEAYGRSTIYWLVKYGDDIGYVSDTYLMVTDEDRRQVDRLMDALQREGRWPIVPTIPVKDRPSYRWDGGSNSGGQRNGGGGCCKICRKGKACGDSCISESYTCHQPDGCACNGS